MAQEPDAASLNMSADAKPLFVCDVLDADENSGLLVDTGETKKTTSGKIRNITWAGLILYVRLVSGALPSPVSQVQDATAQFDPGAFSPTPARLISATGHVYEMTLLGSFPELSEMSPSMRAWFHPASDAGSESRPVILKGMVDVLVDAFRPRNAQLIATHELERLSKKPARRTHSKRQARLQRVQEANEYGEQIKQFSREKRLRMLAVRNMIQELGPDAAIDPLLAALNDELEGVRGVAAHQLGRIADRLPVALFLSAIREKTRFNAAVCQAAAYVFLAHADEAPVEALLDLYQGGDAPWYTNVHVTAIEAMGRLGARVTDEVVALLADIVTDRRGYGLLELWSAARALEALGSRAPVEALIAALHSDAEGVPPMAARALLRHPAPIPVEILEEARLLSDDETARRIHYARIRERLNQRNERPS